MRKSFQIVVDVLTGVAVLCAATMTGLSLHDRMVSAHASGMRPSTARKLTSDEWAETVSAGHRMGSVSPRISIVEFGDFECPACGGFEKSLHRFREAHPLDVAVVFRHWPLPNHRLAYATARAAECAGDQGVFEKFHDAVYEHQDSLGILTFDQFARRAGVIDLKRFDQCVANPAAVKAIDRDVAMAAKLGGRGTPTIAVNGELLEGVPTLTDLESMLKNSGPQVPALAKPTDAR